MLSDRDSTVIDMMHRNRQLDDVDPYSRNISNRPLSGKFWDDDANDATYELDHLATYTVSPHRGLATPAEAIKRLRRMIVTTGVWTRRLRLRVGSRDLVVVDGVEAVERFSLRLVGNVVHSTSCDSFDNVVAFVVTGDELLRKPGEIHVFQCIGCQGQDLVNDIEAAKTGQPLPSKLSDLNNAVPQIYPRPQYKQQSTYVTVSEISPNHSESSDHSGSVLSPENRKRIDLKVLDLCFGEIEDFTTKLQRAAIDAKDTTKTDGERIQPPEAKNFYDMFQKFKLIFILLARLKHDIHDPNAPELVKILFTPFTIIIDASRKAEDGEAHLASQVVSPLLTPAAIEFLANCLTSEQMDLWRSLGRAWNTPRNRWNEPIPPFVLVFANGQSPPRIWIDEIVGGQNEYSSYYNLNGHSRQQSQDTTLTAASTAVDHTRRVGTDSTDNAQSLKDGRQKNYLRDLQARGAKAYTITKRRDGSNPKELTVEVDDIVEVIDDSKNWWKVKNCDGDIGHVPNNFLRPYQ